MKKSLLALVLLQLCRIGVVGAESSQINTESWKVLNPTAQPFISAIGEFPDGVSVYAAGSISRSYKIYLANKYGMTEIPMSVEAPGEIKRLFYTRADREYNLGDFTYLQNEHIYTYRNQIIENISASMPVAELSYDVSCGLDCKSTYGEKYHYNGNTWDKIDKANTISEPYLSYTSGISRFKLDAGILSVNTSIEKQQLDIKKIEYVSDAFEGDREPSKGNVIYRVTAQGQGLDQYDMFIKGYNGFSYIASMSDDMGVKYEQRVYPLTGLTYEDDGDSCAVVNPRDIIFYFKGPVSTNASPKTITLKEYVWEFNINEKEEFTYGNRIFVNQCSKVVPMESEEHRSLIKDLTRDKYKYGISVVSGPRGFTYGDPTGTCAIPIRVKLYKDNKPIPLSSPLYKCVSFYITKNSRQYDDGLIGSDIYDEKHSFTAVTDRECVEINGDNKFIKYGVTPKINLNHTFLNLNGSNEENLLDEGKLFYFFVKKSDFQDITICAGIATNDEIILSSGGNFILKGIKSGESLKPEVIPNSSTISKITVSENGQNVDLSNNNIIPKIGLVKSYPDYVACTEDSISSFVMGEGIYIVFQEGISSNKFLNRLVLNRLRPGMSFRYNDESGARDFHVSEYTFYDKSGLCKETKNKMCIGYIFTSSGKYHSLSYPEERAKKSIQEGGTSDYWSENYMSFEVNNMPRNKPDEEYSNGGIPIIVAGEDDKGRELFSAFAPPGTNVTFVSDSPSRIWNTLNPEQISYKVCGYPLFSKNILFESELIKTARGGEFDEGELNSSVKIMENKLDGKMVDAAQVKSRETVAFNAITILRGNDAMKTKPDQITNFGVYYTTKAIAKTYISRKDFNPYTDKLKKVFIMYTHDNGKKVFYVIPGCATFFCMNETMNIDYDTNRGGYGLVFSYENVFDDSIKPDLVEMRRPSIMSNYLDCFEDELLQSKLKFKNCPNTNIGIGGYSLNYYSGEFQLHHQDSDIKVMDKQGYFKDNGKGCLLSNYWYKNHAASLLKQTYKDKEYLFYFIQNGHDICIRPAVTNSVHEDTGNNSILFSDGHKIYLQEWAERPLTFSIRNLQ